MKPMFRGDRLEALMAERGISQSELARRIKVSQTTIWKLIKEPAQGTKFTHRIASELQTSAEYLMDETENPLPTSGEVADNRRSFRGPSDETALTMPGLVPVKEIDLTLGAGGTYLDDSAVMETIRYFPRDWLREFTDAPPDMLVFARVKGDSMKPTLLDGAIVIIDLRRKRINEQDEVWSIAVADIGMVKRIWANADGSYKIKSDNPNVGAESAHDDEMFVIGRVVASIGKH